MAAADASRRGVRGQAATLVIKLLTQTGEESGSASGREGGERTVGRGAHPVRRTVHRRVDDETLT